LESSTQILHVFELVVLQLSESIPELVMRNLY